MREGIDDKAFPEQGAKVSIHSDGSFEGLGCVLANTNLNVLTAVFYWFTLKRDEPNFCLLERDETALVYGLIGRFWQAEYGLEDVADGPGFLAFAQPGVAKLALGYVVTLCRAATAAW